uniref:Peptidase S1 domain-containing protein n=1 Tax=Heliothis virescens TaxID=7102 RepID=A0A2A4J4C1_HELVI
MLSLSVICVLLNIPSCLNFVSSSASCGIDNSATSHVYDGMARIETYPWLGTLYYPYGTERYTTAVVLVTRQIALGTATEIDELPKDDFRARARVVIGQNCSGESVGIRDYSIHSDYRRKTHSTLAIIQLETDHVKMNCTQSAVRVHKMKYVSPEECTIFYRRAGLDLDSMWPMHTACAKSVTGGHCVWRSGAILVIKIDRRWRLLGFGIYGPGCEAPSRFLDYSMYHDWVQRSVETIGRPAVTKVAPNYLILRRTSSNVRRFGECDQEEMKAEIYTDTIKMRTTGKMVYNLTIVSAFEYSCIIFKATSDISLQEPHPPTVNLRRWCSGPFGVCASGFQYLEIHFFVEVNFLQSVNLHIGVYGKQAKVIDRSLAYRYLNSRIHYPDIDDYEIVKDLYRHWINDTQYIVYGKKQVQYRQPTTTTKKPTTPKPKKNG